MRQQCIDNSALRVEKQAASLQKSGELKELRGKNKSCTVRLHETLKWFQNLKTEKNQMGQKISQLSEENGDLSFKLPEPVSHLRQRQGAYNDPIEEHIKASQEWAEKQARLENELSTALQNKNCLEKKNETLQGKLAQLEERAAHLWESPAWRRVRCWVTPCSWKL